LSARLLNGNLIRDQILSEVKTEVEALAQHGIRPGLAAVLAGDNPASKIYVRNKTKACAEVGIYSETITPPQTITTDEMLALVADLNGRDEIDGILVQLPLPPQVDSGRVLLAVQPEKDVDGFHPANMGLLVTGRPGLVACTPAGLMEILKRSGIPIAGQHAVVIGRSDIVGKPAALLLLHENATVTICHSKTRDLAAVARQADILVAAIGRPAFVTADMVKPGAVVIDVGINRVGDRLVGDVHYDPVADVASAITPVPGGVGPMTIAMLLRNTLTAARIAVQSKQNS
jgi:methylenetetrahydrofolate dehydrogenase (NADP+)/methenyltetrahydrofolate cyclohydrolase